MNPRAFLRIVTLWVLTALPLLASAESDAQATLVLYNEDDPSSITLAATYATARGIPLEQMVGLPMPLSEEISREAYESQIAGPLRRLLVERGWWRVDNPTASPLKVRESKIRYVALMRGVPLKIASATVLPEGNRHQEIPSSMRRTSKSVDSELARLGLGGAQITGPLSNPFWGALGPLEKDPIPGLLLVCRLDGPTPNHVHQMIIASLEAEKSGLWGFAYVDSRAIKDGAYVMGDDWLRRAARNLSRAGIPCIHENTPKLFPGAYPMTEAALYYGWYSGAVAGPFARTEFRFVPGAVAVHIYSFSANTLRDPQKSWCAALIDRGAAATLGNVYEPYLTLTPNLAEFDERLRKGQNFAEAAYASQRVISWMTTFVGDPLYRPFAGNQKEPRSPAARAFAAYRKGARLWFNTSRAAGTKELTARGRALKSGVIFEGLATLQQQAGQQEAALQSLAQARRYYSGEEDQIRCVLHAAGLMANIGNRKGALALIADGRKAYPHAPAKALLDELAGRLNPPPPSSTSPQSPKPSPSPKAASSPAPRR